MQSFAEIANITFTEITEDNTPSGPVGDIRIAYSDALIPTPAAGWAYGPSIYPNGGDIWIESTYTGTVLGGFSVHTLAHELGHALGLDHPFHEDPDNPDPNKVVLPAATDTKQYTIMSYESYYSDNLGGYFPSHAQLYDIAALHYLYGANMTTRTENTVYSMDSGTIPEYVYCIWDAGGNDTLSAEGTTVGATINLGEGEFSSIGHFYGVNAYDNISIAFGAVIENATGSSYADTLTGNDVANKLFGKAGGDTLNGGAGNDVLNGGGGSDHMVGGTGDDKYYVDNVGDTSVENVGEGVDLVFASISHTLAANVENLFLTGSANSNGTGNALNNVIKGNNLVNKLSGGSGDDKLSGKGGNDVLIGGAGNDTLIGGDGNDKLNGQSGTNTMMGDAGNDRYYVSNDTEVLWERSGEGTDTVIARINFTLGKNFENLFLKGSANINGIGNSANNIIKGNSGDNILLGGAGNDRLYGGYGNDKLKGGGGNDTLYGDAGNDKLFGQAGTNTMLAGVGNDRYYVQSATDVIVENANEGKDTVYSSVSFTLAANVEQLILTGSGGVNGTGNSGHNLLVGNGANNTLTGNIGRDTLRGGAGIDQLYGGKGRDVFEFTALTDAGDVIHDFNAAGGEYLKVGTLLSSLGWGGGDAVAGGWLGLVQNGANVDVMLDTNGSAAGGTVTTLATINNEDVAGLGANWWLA